MTQDSNELVLTREYPWNTKKEDLPDVTIDGTVWLPDYLIRTTPVMVRNMKGRGNRYTDEDRRLKCIVVYTNADSLKGKLILEERAKTAVK